MLADASAAAAGSSLNRFGCSIGRECPNWSAATMGYYLTAADRFRPLQPQGWLQEGLSWPPLSWAMEEAMTSGGYVMPSSAEATEGKKYFRFGLVDIWPASRSHARFASEVKAVCCQAYGRQPSASPCSAIRAGLPAVATWVRIGSKTPSVAKPMGGSLHLCFARRRLVDPNGFEPLTSSMPLRRSTN